MLVAALSAAESGQPSPYRPFAGTYRLVAGACSTARAAFKVQKVQSSRQPQRAATFDCSTAALTEGVEYLNVHALAFITQEKLLLVTNAPTRALQREEQHCVVEPRSQSLKMHLRDKREALKMRFALTSQRCGNDKGTAGWSGSARRSNWCNHLM